MKHGDGMKKGWEVKRLGECFKLKSGEALVSNKMQEGDIPVFGGNGIAGYHNEFNLHGSNVIIGRVGALCGKVRHITKKIWLTDNAFHVVDFNYSFDHAFLSYLLNFKNLRNYARQAAQPVISNSSLKEVDLEFPSSISEQQCIVTILNEAFAAIAKAKENAEKNLVNARGVFEAYLQSVFTNPAIGWEKKKLCEVAEIKGGGTPSKAVAKYWNGTIPWVSPKDMKCKEIFDAQDHISMDAIENSSTSLVRSGAILIVVRSGILAHTVPLAITRKDVTINQDIKALIQKKEVAPEFLFYHLSALHKVLLSLANRGATVHRLPSELLGTLKVSIPSLQVQKSIVGKIDNFFSETQNLEAIYKQKLADLDELKKSILEKVFTGELKTEKV